MALAWRRRMRFDPADSTGTLLLTFDCEGKWGMADCLSRRHQALYTTERLEETYTRLVSMLSNYAIDATFAFTAAFTLSGHEFDRLTPEMETLRVGAHEWMRFALAGIEKDDGVGWFAPACLDAVKQHGTHEIASHGFSHLPWRARFATRAVLDSELALCRLVPGFSSEEVRTFVFPRNQVAHLDLLPIHGFRAYRKARRPRSRFGNLASEFNLLSRSEQFSPSGEIPAPIPAGSLLNWRYGLRRMVPPAMTVRRWKHVLQDAAQRGGVVHAWTHPENFVDGYAMFPMLEAILRFAADERDAGRLRVLTSSQLIAG